MRRRVRAWYPLNIHRRNLAGDVPLPNLINLPQPTVSDPSKTIFEAGKWIHRLGVFPFISALNQLIVSSHISEKYGAMRNQIILSHLRGQIYQIRFSERNPAKSMGQ